MKTILSKNETETKKIGESIGKKCVGGEVFCLIGDLGTGKTTLSQGIAKGLGINKIINSPTFIITNIYKIKKNKRIKELIHIDAYRLKNLKEIEKIGFFDLLKEKENVIIIEWGEKIEKYLNKNYIKIKIKNKKENAREITIF